MSFRSFCSSSGECFAATLISIRITWGTLGSFTVGISFASSPGGFRTKKHLQPSPIVALQLNNSGSNAIDTQQYLSRNGITKHSQSNSESTQKHTESIRMALFPKEYSSGAARACGESPYSESSVPCSFGIIRVGAAAASTCHTAKQGTELA